MSALITASGVGPRTLRSRLHRLLPDASDALTKARASTFVAQAARHIDQSHETFQATLAQLD